ncbi:MAG: uroporphyrinogen decarboxylase family protein [Candidatus Atabeyarchaeum deiterrae]
MPRNRSSDLSPFDRVRSAIELRETDRVPVVPEITYTCGRLVHLKFSEALKSAEKMAKALVTGYKEFGYDGIYAGWEGSFTVTAEAMGSKLKIPDDGIPSVDGALVNQETDLDKIRIPDPKRDGRLPLHLQSIKLIRESVGDKVPIFSYVPGPLTLSGLLRKTDVLMLDLIRNPKMVHSMNRLTMEASKAFALAKIESGADVIVVADPSASTTMISPKMFEGYSLPYLKEILNQISKAGAIPSLHICGQTTPILEGMVESGAKILELDSQVNLKEAKHRVGAKICIQGNVNPTGILMQGSVDDVIREARRCIEDAAKGGGFILSSGCEVPYEAKIANIKSLVEAALKFGKYGSIH